LGADLLQRYKLRLQDGTVLVVDHDGLSAWLVDGKAMVQSVGSRQWHPLRGFLAEERVAARYESRQQPKAAAALPLIPPKPREDEAPRGPAAPPPIEPYADDAPVHAPAASWHDSLELAPISPSPSLQVLADEPAPPAAHEGRTSTPDDGLPIIPLKPLDEWDEAPARTAAEPGYDEDEGTEVVEDTLRRDSVDDGFLRAFAACEAAIRRWIGRFARPDRRLRPTSAGEGLPIIRLKPFDDEAPPSTAAKHQELLNRVSAWVEGLSAWIDRLTRPDPSSPPPVPLGELASAADPAQREPLKPPAPISELPILRLAVIDDPKEAEDIYEGEGVVHPAWLWTKRIVLTAGLVAGGVMAALTWETWLPQAAQRGRILATKVDKYAQSRDQAERRRRALQEAGEQLPHLAPETIQVVLSLDPEIVLEPPQVFRVAYDAAERGLSALVPGEAQELKTLRSTLLGTLRPAERERVREYDRARAQRVTLPFEDRDVLELFARGAGALPSRSRERLQALSGKAIAAGLRMGVSPDVP
jgi:hypothetical protein